VDKKGPGDSKSYMVSLQDLGETLMFISIFRGLETRTDRCYTFNYPTIDCVMGVLHTMETKSCIKALKRISFFQRQGLCEDILTMGR
jgi:hypothetical protein